MVTAAIIITTITIFILLLMINDLKSTVNKQQEQIDRQQQYIDELMRRTSSQLNLIELVVDTSKDIANKVISIEERVDKYTKIVE